MVEETLVATSNVPHAPPRRTHAEERLDLGLLQCLAEDGHGSQVTLQGGGAAPLGVLATGRRGGHHPLGGGLSRGPGVGAQRGGDGLGAAECWARGEDQLRPVGRRRVASGGCDGGGGPVACRADAAGGEGLEGRRSCAQPLSPRHRERGPARSLGGPPPRGGTESGAAPSSASAHQRRC